jgi:diguanylate cyclase (GGDEF)-like protein
MTMLDIAWDRLEDFLSEYQEICIMIAGIIVIIILISIFISFRMKMRNQERILQKAQIQEERYRILAEISNDILFEYDIFSDQMVYSDKYTENFGRKATIERFAELKEEVQYVYKEDVFAFENFCKLLGGEKQKLEAEYRMKRSSGDYVWCYVCGQTIYDSMNNPVKVVGKLSNIDIQKREVEKLQFKAEMDAMTRIYNKVATKERINNFIKNSRNQDKHALLIVDMDNFKKINDTFGHLKGDEVLKEGVGHLKNMFRGDDIIGRIGGDEFVVFMSNVTSREDIVNKAKSIGKAFRKTYSEDGEEVTVSASIGISIFPMDGDDYEELLDKSDKALYEVKKNGKNGFCFYHEQKA